MPSEVEDLPVVHSGEGCSRRGLIIVYTGDGKGKTTAALGLALRAAGQRMRVVMIQFIKGSWRYGELEGAKKLSPYLTILPMGRGCFVRTGEDGPDEEDVRLAHEALRVALKRLKSGEYDMVILDEVNYAVYVRLLGVEEVLAILREKPREVHVVLTGRHAPQEFIELADTVTEMKEVKHAFHSGVEAMPGIEF